MTLKVGQTIIHPQRGAGVIEAIVTLGADGEAEQYYNIDLFNGEGRLFVPVNEAESVGVRSALYGESDLLEVFLQDPKDLDDDYRLRQTNVREKIQSGDPIQVAEALRDLTWREHKDKLTKIDTDLKRDAREILVGELAAHMEITLRAATENLMDLLRSAMQKHGVEAEAA